MTTTLTPREEMIQVYSDYHKEAYGFRPRGINYDAMSLEDLEADFARFAAVCEENRNAEAIATTAAVAAFNANIQKLIGMGAKDEATALRWVADAGIAEDGWDIDFHMWKLGLSKYDEVARPIYDKLLPYWQEALEKSGK